MKKCKYNKAWVGECGNKTTFLSNYCNTHKNTKCKSCGNHATHECTATFSFVCGVPLCDECEHVSHEKGFTHKKKIK